MEHEKVFNLQLAVQKLEEELSLYRNGTTGAELFELIGEKDAEIAELQRALSEKDLTLRKIAKSSAEVLQRCDALQDKNDHQAARMQHMTQQIEARDELLEEQQQAVTAFAAKAQEQQQQLQEAESRLAQQEEKLQQLEQQLQSSQQQLQDERMLLLKKDAQNNALQSEVAVLQHASEQQQQSISQLKDAASSAEKNVEKLQLRCAELVAEKSEKLRQLDKERQDMLGHVQKFRDSMNANLAQRDEALRRKEERIKELNMQLSIAQQDAKLKSASFGGEKSAERDALFEQKVQLANLQSELEKSQYRNAQLYEAEKSSRKAAEQQLQSAQRRITELEQQQQQQLLMQHLVPQQQRQSQHSQCCQLELPSDVLDSCSSKLQPQPGSTHSTSSLSSSGNNNSSSNGVQQQQQQLSSRRRSLSDRTNRMTAATADNSAVFSVPKTNRPIISDNCDSSALHFDANDFASTITAFTTTAATTVATDTAATATSVAAVAHGGRKVERSAASSSVVLLPAPQSMNSQTCSRLR